MEEPPTPNRTYYLVLAATAAGILLLLWLLDWPRLL